MSKELYATKCRACMFPLNAVTNVVPIFKEYKSNTVLAHMIAETIHTLPEPGDRLGGNVCKLCAEKIYAFYEFRLSYLESEKKLREMLQNYETNQRLTASCSESVSSMSVTDDDSAVNSETKVAEATNNRFDCPDCGRRFERELELRIHSHTHRKNETPSQNNDSRNGFDDQYLIANIKSEPVEYDLDPFYWADAIQSDVDNSYGGDDDLRWKCTICDKRFLRRAHLRSHRRQHALDRSGKSSGETDNNESIPQFKCEANDLSEYKKKPNLNLTADASLERWQCKKCFSTFRTRRMLRDHNVVHRNASAISMPTVDLFSILHNATADETSSPLFNQSEIDSVSPKEPLTQVSTSPKSHSTPMRWKCPKCRKVFETQKALRKHRLAHHKSFEIKLNLKSKNFSSERKSTSNDLANRKRQLTPRSQFVERDWPCNSCHQVFQRRSVLREHRRIVHMLKPTTLPITLKQELNDSGAEDFTETDVNEN